MSESPEWGQAIDQTVDQLWETMRNVRRHLHQRPEPSGHEEPTVRFLAEQLSIHSVDNRIVAEGRGLIVDAMPDSDLPRVVMRGDTDALRIQDEKIVEYRSQHPNQMHACGHDAHSSMVLGATLALKQIQHLLPWPTPWRAIFQPAEETAEGALEMVKVGAVDNTKAIVALHVDPEKACGDVAMREGPMTACCQFLEIHVTGKGGHAARPHHSVDPIIAAVQLVNQVYQLVPRTNNAHDPAVVTFGVIQGGNNPNVIPETVILKGTTRSMSRESAERMGKALEQIADGVMTSTGAAIEVRRHINPDAVINHPDVTRLVWQSATEAAGALHVHHIPEPSMGGEDFANYLRHVPGCLFRLGVAREGHPKHFLHSPYFDIDERALALGAKILARSLVLLANPEIRIEP